MAARFPPTLVIHGGAGARGPSRYRAARARAIVNAAERGASVLGQGGSALDSVIAAVVAMENHPLFNAGYGSVLNLDGKIEMDASVMVSGPPPRAGAVGAVTRVKNPVQLARAVMERTPHLLMVGAAAERLARGARLELCSEAELITDRALRRWQRLVKTHRTPAAARSRRRSRATGHGTVGAVALDQTGLLAAATSTGGTTGKLTGRVGDSAVIGAGTWADPSGAASATGVGEAIIFSGLCRRAVMALAAKSPAAAAALAIDELARLTGSEAGVVLVDRRGRVGWAHNAETMGVVVFSPIRGVRHLIVNARKHPPLIH